MINIARGLPLPIENTFRSVESEVKKLQKKVEAVDTGATQAELANLSREVSRLTRKDNDESWLDLWPFQLGDPGFAAGGSGTALTVGYHHHIWVPIPVRIVGWTLIGDVSGSLDLDVEKNTYTAFNGTGTSICGSELPTLISALKNQNNTIATWTQNVEADSVLSIKVVAVLGILHASLVLKVRRM